MRTITGKEAVGRGRDLEILTVEVVGGKERTALRAVVCPKEQRARPVDDCVPCVDGTGPVSSPTSEAGYFGCTGQETRDSRGGAESAASEGAPATAVMTRGVVAFSVDVPVEAARAELLRRGLAGAPVVNREGRPVGVLTLLELARAAAGSTPSPSLVGDVMVKTAIAVADTAPVAEIASTMSAETLSLLPVVAREGYVVGVVTALDLVKWMASRDGRGARALP